jgi:fatty-acyl-CoA synthase
VSTPTQNSIPLRLADFTTLSEALDYAAEGETGANFYAGSGKLSVVLPYRTLRTQALALARRLKAFNLKRGSRLAIVAETNPDFLCFFFACQYAGLVPVALPASINLGGHEVYVNRLRGLLEACEASIAIASEQFLKLLKEAAANIPLAFIGTPESFWDLPEDASELQASDPSEMAYIQYTSGSTSFPRGVVITQKAVLANLYGVANHGVCMSDDDRCLSWLPFYHDMGLVGCLLVLMATQRSVDYIDTRDFAMRPRRWS